MKLAPHNAADWATSLFGDADLGDTRRTNRLVDIATRAALHTGRSAAFACEGSGALLEGTYRFIRNNKVSPVAIRNAGFDATASLVVERDEVWVMEDTTSLSYRHQVAGELGKLGASTDKARGWWVHSDLMIDATTTQTLGLVHQEWWCRPNNPEDADEKESGKWEAAAYAMRNRFGEQMDKVITVCDREADLFAYLKDKTDHDERFVVRARHLRRVKESQQDLFKHLAEQDVLGGYQVKIPQKTWVDKQGKRHNRPARTANLQVRTAQITVAQNKTPLTLNAVLADEISPPKGEQPLRWLLLTTEPVSTLDEALKIIRIYSARWRVEDFHKSWKTGAGAERQRMVEPDHLERMVSILGFIGVRLMQLRESFTLPVMLRSQGLEKEAKQVEKMHCDTVLVKDEWELLWLTDKKKQTGKTPKALPKRVPSLQWAYQAIARLGGFSDSKRTGIASWSTLWAGWDKLQQHLGGYLTAKEFAAAALPVDG